MPIVEAVGTIVVSKNKLRAKLIEAAMVAAIKDCYNKGITNPDEIRAAQLAAKEALDVQ
jgi:hypothetical protein